MNVLPYTKHDFVFPLITLISYVMFQMTQIQAYNNYIYEKQTHFQIVNTMLISSQGYSCQDMESYS